MKGNLASRIFLVTILLGVPVSSTVYGSHLDSSSHSPGQPKIHQPKQAQKQVSPIRKTPVSLPQVISHQPAPFPSKPRPFPTVADQKKRTPKLHSKLGWRFLLNEQPQAAMSAYRQALRQNPESAHAYLGLGISLKRLGKLELAKKAFLKAVNLNPRLPSALVHLGYLYAEGQGGQSDLSKARKLFRQASQLGDPFATIALMDMKTRPSL